jgi:signal transduction histidine kinase
MEKTLISTQSQLRGFIPQIFALGGTCISLALSYIFWQNSPHFLKLLTAYTVYLPWMILLAGLIFSFLIAALIRTVQLSKQQSLILKEMKKNIQNEIGERIQAEEMKQKLEIALLQGQKLQAIGTLAGGIAHDFNNLLYAIIGYVQMAREDVAQESLVHKNLGKVLEAGKRGQELVARILAFSRRQQHQQFNPLNLRTTIETALALLKPTIPASVTIHIDSIVDAYILGNQTQIHQVLVNIINNAVDAMDGEGEIHFQMDHLPPAHPFLKQFNAILPRNYCKIEISDTGHGMDQATLDRIFEPFFTTKEVGKGTGLGLSIVHSIIKEHEGEISVSSQLGKGSTMVILLPEHAHQGEGNGKNSIS